MKNIVVRAVLLLYITFVSSALNAHDIDEYFYYYKNEKVYLNLDTTHVFLVSKKILSENNIEDKGFFSIEVLYSREDLTMSYTLPVGNITKQDDSSKVVISDIKINMDTDSHSSTYASVVRKLRNTQNVIKGETLNIEMVE